MRRRRSFVPSLLHGQQLEERIVLNGSAGNQSASSVLLQGLGGSSNAFRAHSAPATAALINLAYQSFQQDFNTVRATYLAAVKNGTATQSDLTAFQNYTLQRTNLLAQQVTNSLLLYKPGVGHGPKLDSPLPIVIFEINGVTDKARSMARQPVPLATQLTGITPADISSRTPLSAMTTTIDPIPAPGSSATTIALDTIAQDSAIQASLTMTLNSITIIRNGNFGNGNSHN